MLDSARDVMEGSALLIEEAKQALVCPGDAESQQRLAQVRWLGLMVGRVNVRQSSCARPLTAMSNYVEKL